MFIDFPVRWLCGIRLKVQLSDSRAFADSFSRFAFAKIGVLNEPRVNHRSLESPLIANPESRDFSLSHQTINRELVYS
jgi:hypothetical protein